MTVYAESNIHSTPVLPQRMKVVAAYRRCMHTYMAILLRRGPTLKLRQFRNYQIGFCLSA